jgi:hypothetical protein
MPRSFGQENCRRENVDARRDSISDVSDDDSDDIEGKNKR